MHVGLLHSPQPWMTLAAFEPLSTNAVSILNSGTLAAAVLGGAVAIAVALITGSFTLLAVRATATWGHQKRFVEWTWDRAFDAYTELDRTHREVTHQLEHLSHFAKPTGGIDAEMRADYLALVRSFTNTVSKCSLLTRNQAVQKYLDNLHATTVDAITHVLVYQDRSPSERDNYYRQFIDLHKSACDARNELSKHLNGDLITLTKKR